MLKVNKQPIFKIANTKRKMTKVLEKVQNKSFKSNEHSFNFIENGKVVSINFY